MRLLKSCPKKYNIELDKACPPEETVANIRKVLSEYGSEILAETKRIDTGRLGIPVYMSMCGPKARSLMPTRKQMGKGASPVQAEASALMELVERFSFFTFWSTPENFQEYTWSEAMEDPSIQCVSIEKILKSVGESLDHAKAIEIMDLIRWRFCPALNVSEEVRENIPVDWFKKLNEFNGSSAGNTMEEAILQGACELVERHVCAYIDRELPTLPSIDPASFQDEALIKLWKSYADQGIKLFLKDFSLDLPVPTVGALAYDPKSFPHLSEIVFTAGTATSPAKAAIRALTEIAQLAGDFETGSNYEASGLCKFTDLEQIEWIKKGKSIPLDSLPNLEGKDIYNELKDLCRELKAQGYAVYSVETTLEELDVPACYTIIPGFAFRERTPNASLGMFVGRILAEDFPLDHARNGLDTIAKIYPDAPFLPFYQGMLQLRQGNTSRAREFFQSAIPVQETAEDEALTNFYAAYTLTQEENWPEAIPYLDQAIRLDPNVHEFYNLRGVSRYKTQDFSSAATDFQHALVQDGGSAMDYANLGMCYKEMKKPQMAKDFLSLALEIEPGLDFARDAFESLQKNH